jgi:hypothetical protein
MVKKKITPGSEPPVSGYAAKQARRTSGSAETTTTPTPAAAAPTPPAAASTAGQTPPAPRPRGRGTAPDPVEAAIATVAGYIVDALRVPDFRPVFTSALEAYVKSGGDAARQLMLRAAGTSKARWVAPLRRKQEAIGASAQLVSNFDGAEREDALRQLNGHLVPIVRGTVE